MVTAGLRVVGFDVVSEPLGRRAARHVRPQVPRQGSADPVEAVVLDLSKQPLEGLALLASLRQADRWLPIVLVAPRYDRALYDRLLGYAPAVVFEIPAGIEAVVGTVLNLLPLVDADEQLAS
jgi:hypothetical protein